MSAAPAQVCLRHQLANWETVEPVYELAPAVRDRGSIRSSGRHQRCDRAIRQQNFDTLMVGAAPGCSLTAGVIKFCAGVAAISAGTSNVSLARSPLAEQSAGRPPCDDALARARRITCFASQR